MRLLFVAGRAWPAVGGVETLIRHVSRAIAEDHEVTVLALRADDGPSSRLSNSIGLPPPFEPYMDGRVRYEPLVLSHVRRAALVPQALQMVPVLRRYAFGSIRRAIAAQYARVVAPVIARRAEGVDIIHTWTADLVAAAGVRAAKLAGAKATITPFLHVGQWGADPASVSAYRRADRVVALLETEKRSLVELGVPAEKVRVCGACTPDLAMNGAPGVRAIHGIEGPLVLFVGARRPYKGVDLLLEASPRVAKQAPDVTFAFVGPGRAVEAPDGVRVVDAGCVEGGELAAWMAAADLLCLPSAHEIFPTSMLEAWSEGTPTLASDIPTLRELIDKSGGGAVVRRDPTAIAEAIIGLLADPAKLREYGERGRQFWRANHTPQTVAECYARQYEQL